MRLSSAIFACIVAATVFTSTCKAQLTEALLLTLSSNSRSDQTAVRFLHEASDAFDGQCDAYKLMNPYPTPNIYTVADEYYAINALNNDFSEKEIALHIRTPFAALYTITAEEIGAFDSSWTIHLTDLFLNQDIDLRKVSSYSFMSDPSNLYHRFSLRFTRSGMAPSFITETSPEAQTGNDPIIYNQEGKIMVSADGEEISSISIHDLEGHSVYQSEATTENCTFSPNKNGIYVVHLSTRAHTYTKKVMID